MQARMLLALLASSRLDRPGPASRAREGGFSMAALFIVLLIVITGTISVAIRGGSGSLASRLQSQSIEARDVAEAGLEQVISELNKRENRRMLVSGLSMGAWSTTPDARQQNPCAQLPTATPTLGTARSLAGNTEQNLVSGNTSRTFVLKAVRYSNKDRSRWNQYSYGTSGTTITASSSSPAFDNSTNQLINLSSASPNNSGFIEITVEGRVYRNGAVVSRSTVTKEYRVVPKCCDRSFYGPSGSFGNDARVCVSGGTSNGRLGVVTGFSGGGVTKASGSAGEILDPDGDKLEAILCITTTATCGGAVNSISTTKGAVPVTPLAIALNPPPRFPSSTVTATGAVNKSSGYLRVNAAGTAVESCSYNSKTNTLSSCSTTSYCIASSAANIDAIPAASSVDGNAVTAAQVADFHCNMTEITLSGSDNFYFDSTGGKLAFYFDNTPGTISTAGTTGIYHRYCSTFPGATTGCTTAALANQFDRLAFYGNQTYNFMDLQGTPQAFSFYAYFRQGEIAIGGNAEAQGSLWSNNLTLNGSYEIAAPPTGCTSGSSGFCTLIGGGTNPSEVVFDWVARSTAQTRLY